MTGIQAGTRAAAALLCSLVLAAVPASASNEGVLGAYFHTAWGTGDGAPADVQEMAQTPDGWLWAGSSSGLYRFDGLRWERVTAIDGNPLPQSSIMSLAVIDGALWVGYQFGGASRFKDGKVRHYGQADGLPGSTLFSFLKTSDGKMLAATPVGVFELKGDKWSASWPKESDPPKFAVMLRQYGDETWLGGETELFVRGKGQTEFRRVHEGKDRQPLSIDASGDIWTAGDDGALRYDRKAGRFLPASAAQRDISSIYHAPDGSLWVNRKNALERVDPVTFATQERITRQTGLSGAGPIGFLNDSEGNLWVSTDAGIDRLRRNKVMRLAVSGETHYPGVLPVDGGVWVSSSENNPLRLIGTAGKVSEGGLQNVQSMARSPDGTLWFANAEHILRIGRDGRQLIPLEAPDENHIQMMTPARDGGIWVSRLGKPTILRVKDGKWSRHDELKAFARSTPVSLFEDSAGRLWQGYTKGRLAVAEGKAVTSYTEKEGVTTGNVLAFAESGGAVWIGGETGLMAWHGGKLVTMQTMAGKPFLGISGIVQGRGGDLWLNGIEGLTRIPSADWQRALRDGSGKANFERFDFHNGVEGVAPQLRPIPSLVQAQDGKLWFTTNNTVHWIDPDRVLRNTAPPPVQMLDVNVDGKQMAASPNLELPPRAGTVQLNYTGLSLGMPERMAFRYKLEGVDRDWQEAGNRRSAFYTNLAPGSYRFHVKAANEDGVWNEKGATLAFAVAPTLTQTWWFRALCVAAAALVLWLLYRLRLRQLAARLRNRYEARIDERERIARDLHDTLLQSVQGMLMKVQAAIMPVSAEDPLRQRIEGALQSAEHSIGEARDKVRELRSGENGADIVALFGDRGRELAEGTSTRFELSVNGKAQALEPAVLEQLAGIACEALANAFRHGGAKLVQGRIDFGARELTLAVRDDGQGIPADVQAAGRREGHFGMIGMRERAAKINAKLQLRSSAESGTEWTLTVPGALAYR
ncbi:sensor histidine kinase [Massilia sp. SM-13]|uniref:sensor histidine kinase n=1 Tax=Pseudoduganella rhizocola TaxID=3382643 RepID=UPI0038B66662